RTVRWWPRDARAPRGISAVPGREDTGGASRPAGLLERASGSGQSSQPPERAMTPAKISATVLMTLMSGLIEGPAVSLYGSPTVSPTTAAAWASEPLPPWLPSSMYFLALSQAPPPFDIDRAIIRPEAITPISRPPSASGPQRKPTTAGQAHAMTPDSAISRSAARVTMSTALP